MKKIGQIREQYNLVTDKERNETDKIVSLCEAGLLEENKVSIVKRALSKKPEAMTIADRKGIAQLAENFIAEANFSKDVKMKRDTLTKFDPRQDRNFKERDIPYIVVLKRKGIRIFGDNQKIGLYYSQELDRYVSIPFTGNKGGHFGPGTMDEEVEQIDEALPAIAAAALPAVIAAGKAIAKSGVRSVATSGAKSAAKRALSRVAKSGAARKVGELIGRAADATSNKDDDEEKKYLKTPEGRKKEVTVSKPKSKATDNQPDTVQRQLTTLSNRANQAMVKENVLEQLRTATKSLKESVILVDGNDVTINSVIARKIVNVYESVNSKNKKKIEQMLNENTETFKTIVNFAVRQ